MNLKQIYIKNKNTKIKGLGRITNLEIINDYSGYWVTLDQNIDFD